jgi:hypothetical protein
MTEAEWLTSADSRALLDSLANADPRKLRQFACECWHRARPQSRGTDLVVVYQRYLDGEATPTDWFEAYSGFECKGAIQDLIAPEPFEAARRMTGFSWGMRGSFVGSPLGPVDRPEEAALLRDIFGNPFRPVEFDPEWQTDTAVTLAQLMCDSREFSAMPILADALQDAGCDSDELLNHLRDTSLTHVRGCWVFDLVLNRSGRSAPARSRM